VFGRTEEGSTSSPSSRVHSVASTHTSKTKQSHNLGVGMKPSPSSSLERNSMLNSSALTAQQGVAVWPMARVRFAVLLRPHFVYRKGSHCMRHRARILHVQPFVRIVLARNQCPLVCFPAFLPASCADLLLRELRLMRLFRLISPSTRMEILRLLFRGFKSAPKLAAVGQ